jgi:hypothetical protein
LWRFFHRRRLGRGLRAFLLAFFALRGGVKGWRHKRKRGETRHHGNNDK